MQAQDAVLIEFEGGFSIPLDEVFSFCDQSDRWEIPRKVIWKDGSYSWAKGWWQSDRIRLISVGAGAYGNMPLLDRPMCSPEPA